MKSLNFRNPSMFISDRSELNAIQEEWIAKNGGVRRFARGHSGEWQALKTLMLELGYDFLKFKRFYQLRRIGSKGRAKNMTWEAAIARIDEILIENGREPFIRRAAA